MQAGSWRYLLVLAAWGTTAFAEDWKRAEPGWRYEFPRDHHAHDEFKTEWWYFTGNLLDPRGRRFGYQLTFFRQGIRAPAERNPNLSRFVVGDLKFAHFTITDAAGARFRFEQKTSRGAFGEAGFDDGERLAWIESWTLRMSEDGGFHLTADDVAQVSNLPSLTPGKLQTCPTPDFTKEAAIDLQLTPVKPPSIHGENGVSAKAAGEGHASHYYSLTRLRTAGKLRIGETSFAVNGESWFDHEWATNQLAPEQVGWDWLSVQFDDGTELMLYQMRLANSSADPASSGTWIAADGTTTHLPSSAFQMMPAHWWTSEKTGAKYPTGWRIAIPERALEMEIRPVLDNQELALMPLAYWEGAVDLTGTRGGKAITGRGYLELTGYAGPLHELQR